MSTPRIRRIIRRIGQLASYRRDLPLAWQLTIVLLLILILGGYALWIIHTMNVRQAEHLAHILERLHAIPLRTPTPVGG